MKKLLNPIEFFDDRKLLTTNLIIFAIGTVIAILMRAWFSSNFSIFFRTEIEPFRTFTENILSVILTALVFLISGKIINKKVRFIDCVNLSLFIRIPSYIASLTNIIGTHNRNVPKINKDGSVSLPTSFSNIDTAILIFTQLLNIIIIIYFIVLIYRSFKTISNAKKSSDYLILVILLIISIALSSFLFRNI